MAVFEIKLGKELSKLKQVISLIVESALDQVLLFANDIVERVLVCVILQLVV